VSSELHWIEWFTAAIATWLLIFPVRWVLRRLGVIDRPNERSSHVKPTVRGGGLAIVIAIGVSVIVRVGWGNPLRLACLTLPTLALAAVSFWDDIRPLRAKWRFLIQAVAALCMLAWILRNESVSMPYLLWPLLFLWVTGYTNAFNFMDGVNGLAGSQALLTGIGTVLVGLASGLAPGHPGMMLAATIAACAAGFLPHNFPRARVFMGDVGSASLGFLLALATMWMARDAGWGLFPWLALLHANFVLDTGITFVRRILRGEKCFSPHREHFYQRLIRAGWTHPAISGVEALGQTAVALMLIWATPLGWGPRVVVAATVVAAWLAFFCFAERRFVGKQVPHQ
jgi:UDP-N-acetylmuramyl pentapeptide phosphotransferase/UDP-N-acetylglucosamine-1-phosphate transferase